MIFANGARAIVSRYRPPNPVTQYMVGSIDFVHGLGMSGHAGHQSVGEKRDMAFRGDLGPLQFFKGAATLLPRGVAFSTGFNTALPSTHGPVSRANGVLDTIGATQSGR